MADLSKTLDEIAKYLRHKNMLFCLKEIHEMGFMDDIKYRDCMRDIVKQEGYICNQGFWTKGIN